MAEKNSSPRLWAAKGMKIRSSSEELTTSSQEETTDKQKIKISFNSKDSKRYFFTKKEDCMTNKETRIAVADKKKQKKKNVSKEVDVMQERATGNLKREVEGSGSSMNSPPNEKEERQETTTFTVLQKKNTRSMSTSERFEECSAKYME